MQRACLCLALAACGAATPQAPPLPPQKFVSTPAPAPVDRKTKVLAVLPKVQEILAERAKAFPNLAVGIVVGNELVWSRGYGARTDAGKEEVNAQTVFRIGSLTKLFTAVAVLMLRDEGKLSLERPLAEKLPELGDIGYPTRDSPPVTLRHLLSHSSGLPPFGKVVPEETKGVTEEEILADAGSRTLSFSPGTEDTYSNLGFAVAGAAIHRVSGVSYQSFVDERILRPLGMTSTVWDEAHVGEGRLAAGHLRAGEKRSPSNLGGYAPSGGLYSSIDDLARWTIFELQAWPPRDEGESGPLRRASLRESQLTFGPARAGRATFGAGWLIYDEQAVGPVLFHNGSTQDYSASLWLAPRRQVGVIALAGSGDFPQLDGITREVLILVAPNVPEPVRPFGAPVKTAMDRVMKLLEQPDEAGVKAAFSERMLKATSPAGIIQTFKDIRADVGACQGVEPLMVRSDTEAVARVNCAKGAFTVTIVVNAAEPYLIEGLVPKPIQ